MDYVSWLTGVFAICAIGSLIMLMIPALSREEVAERRIDAIKNDVRNERRDVFAQYKRRELQRMHSPLYKTASMTVSKLKLKRYLTTTDYKQKLIRAGYRNQFAETLFLFGRLALPLTFTFIAGTYLFMIETWNLDVTVRMAIALLFGYIGMKLPEMMVKNATNKRQDEIRLAWPDGLDLMLICVESGMSIEEGIRKVANEIGIQSMALAEEFMLCLAELSHAPDRSEAYKNMAQRIGLDDVKTTTTALIQAEDQGTAIGQALRTMSQDIREQRMLLAKKKAAALGPKLTVPMILFFLPCIIFVILWPGVIELMGWG